MEVQTQPPFGKKREEEEGENGKKIALCWLGESGHFGKLQSTKVRTYMESKIQELLCGASNFPSLHRERSCLDVWWYNLLFQMAESDTG